MPQSVPESGQPKRRFNWPKGMPQIIALVLVLVVDSLVAPHFYQVVLQDGRLFGSPIDILNRAAPVALLAIGMTLVIATGGIDLSVGAVMAIAGATAASMTVAGHSLPIVLLASLAAGALAGLWNGILVAVLKIQPFVATLILMVAGRGVAQLITSGQIVTLTHRIWRGWAAVRCCCSLTPVIIAIVTLALFWLFTRKTALGMFIEAVGLTSARRKRRRKYPRRRDVSLRTLAAFARQSPGLSLRRIFAARMPITPGCGWSWTPSWRWLSAAAR